MMDTPPVRDVFTRGAVPADHAPGRPRRATPPPTVAAEPLHQHMAQLDGLRCFASLAVVLHHTLLDRYSIFGLNAGLSGVWLFFVLSGFLITGILLQCRDAGAGNAAGVLRAFYARRAVRIVPLYYAVILVAAMLPSSGTLRHDLHWYLLYASNWLMAIRGDWAVYPGVVTWSLGVEEQFYLVWPALVMFCPRRWLPRALVATAALGFASRIVLVALPLRNAWYEMLPVPTTSNLDPLALGAFLAWHRHTFPANTAARLLGVRRALLAGMTMLTTLIAFALSGRGYRIHWVIETCAVALVSVWLVERVATGFPRRAGSDGCC